MAMEWGLKLAVLALGVTAAAHRPAECGAAGSNATPPGSDLDCAAPGPLPGEVDVPPDYSATNGGIVADATSQRSTGSSALREHAGAAAGFWPHRCGPRPEPGFPHRMARRAPPPAEPIGPERKSKRRAKAVDPSKVVVVLPPQKAGHPLSERYARFIRSCEVNGIAVRSASPFGTPAFRAEAADNRSAASKLCANMLHNMLFFVRVAISFTRALPKKGRFRMLFRAASRARATSLLTATFASLVRSTPWLSLVSCPPPLPHSPPIVILSARGGSPTPR